MSTIFMISKNSKTSENINLRDKIDWRRKGKYTVLSNLTIYYKWKNIKKSYKNNKIKISAPK